LDPEIEFSEQDRLRFFVEKREAVLGRFLENVWKEEKGLDRRK